MKNIKLNVLASLLLASSAAFAGITGSPHDLSASSIALSDGNGELCVFCHTPHAASTDMTGAPLWNKFIEGTTATVDTAALTTYANSFTLYGATVAGTAGNTIATSTTTGVSTDGQVNNPSLACLSCHDGVSSIDSIVNAPGSGFNSQAGSIKIDQITTAGGFVSGYNDIAKLTKILTNTHPISIEFVPGNASLRAKDFTLTNAPGNIKPWSGATNIQSLLRGADRVECGSCHDPHNGYGDTDGAGAQDDIYSTNGSALGADANASRMMQVNFLRHSNKGSALCLGCHDK